MPSRPNYQTFTIDLTIAGSQDIRGQFNYLHVVDAESAGAQSLDAIISVELGVANGPKIPLRLDGEIDTGVPVNLFRVTWDAQPGVSVTLFLSMQDASAGVTVKSPPTKQLVTTSAGTQMTNAAVSVRNAANGGPTELTAANVFRQSVTIQNLGAADIYVGGDNTVTTATGVRVSAGGGTYTVDKNTGALWAITATDGQDVRVAVEK